MNHRRKIRDDAKDTQANDSVAADAGGGEAEA